MNEASIFKYSNYIFLKYESYGEMSTSNLYDHLRGQIRPIESVVILGGLYVSYSKWIKFEVNFAKELQKPIVRVQPWGSDRTPKAVKQSANTIVGWNAKTIVSAIREYLE